jgi:hypothetical protein
VGFAGKQVQLQAQLADEFLVETHPTLGCQPVRAHEGDVVNALGVDNRYEFTSQYS